jgi:hypothetical protein
MERYASSPFVAKRRRRRRPSDGWGGARLERWGPVLAGVVMLSGVSIAFAASAEDSSSNSLISVLQRSIDVDNASGMRVGTAIITPSLEVADTYDTNIFATSGREHSDWYASLLPSLAIQSDWLRHSFSLKADGEFRQYDNFSREDVSNVSVAANGRIDLASNAYILAGGGYQLLHEDRGALVPVNGISPTQYTVVSGRTGFVVEPAPLGLRLDATVGSYGYNNAALFGGAVVPENARDHVVYALEPRVTYQVTPQYNAFLRAVVNRRQYTALREPDGIDRSSTGYSADLGTSFKLGGLAIGEFYLGYIRQAYQSRIASPITGVDFGGKIEWRASPEMSLRLDLSRSIEETSILGSPGFMQTALRFGVEHELAPRFLLLGSIGFVNADFGGAAGSSNLYELKLGARYLLSSNFSAGLEYDFGHRASSAALPHYTRQIVELRLRGQL